MQCTNPFIIRNKKNGVHIYTEAPCNRCLACRINKQTEWTIRIKAEISQSKKNATFVTLTYDDQYLKYNEGISTLYKKDLQNFHKRLRSYGEEIKYYCCGEYGETNLRPHYHGIYIGIKDIKNIDKAWGMGISYIGTVTDASIKYVAGYIFSKGKPEDYAPAIPPFQTNSNGIGMKWLEENFNEIKNNKYIRYLNKKIKIPSTWKNKYPELKHPIIHNGMELIKNYKEWIKEREDGYREAKLRELDIKETKIEKSKKIEKIQSHNPRKL